MMKLIAHRSWSDPSSADVGHSLPTLFGHFTASNICTVQYLLPPRINIIYRTPGPFIVP